jgi:hypothetical protein
MWTCLTYVWRVWRKDVRKELALQVAKIHKSSCQTTRFPRYRVVCPRTSDQGDKFPEDVVRELRDE